MIHTDLLACGVIDEPYHVGNELLQRWIPEDDWTYTLSFSTHPSLAAFSFVELTFDGLATIANVSLNGVVVLSTDNQFRVWRAPVRSLLNAPGAGSNVLVVAIASSTRYAAAADAAYNMTTHNITSCPNDVEEGWCFRNFIRQNPCAFSWDWSPPFAPIGIYKRVALLAHNGVVIEGATVRAAPTEPLPLQPGVPGAWALNVTLHIFLRTPGSGVATVLLPTLDVNVSVRVPTLAEGTARITVSVLVRSAQAWWPSNFASAGGIPALYSGEVRFSVDGGNAPVAAPLRVGFRTVELVQEPLPGPSGASFSFAFRINGVETYMKGSNWVPNDAFESRVTIANLSAHFDAFEDAGYNIVRHWGGAIYQRDEFFDLADERGILVFTEFSFANANYPTDLPFLATVAAEVRDQTLRLQAHPSILMWSANNEIARGLGRMWYNGGGWGPHPDPSQFHYFIEDYQRLFFDTVLSTVSAVDSTALFGAAWAPGDRPSLSTSPSQGNNTRSWPIPYEPPGSSGTGNLSGLVDGLWRGDFHGYLYDIDCWNSSEYPRTRFSTEFGLQSWPSLHTMVTYSAVPPAVVANYSDPFWRVRNHHPNGQAQIAFFIAQHYPMPPLSDTRAWLWLSQVSQAYCIRQQAEHYRRLVSDCEPRVTGGGCNRGALYWQASDSWPAPTWSSLEYGGRRKVLHHFAARFFAPFVISLFLEGDLARGGIAVVNEDVVTQRSGQVNVLVVSFVKGLVGVLPPAPFAVLPASSARVGSFTLAQVAAAAGGACGSAAEGCFLVYEAVDVTPPPPPPPRRVTRAGPDFLLLSSVVHGSLVAPNLRVRSVEAEQGAPGRFVVRWTGSAPALFVWLETPLRGVWSDNGFAFVPGLAPGPDTPLIWIAAGDAAVPSAAELEASIRVWSLYDVAAGVELTTKFGV